VAEGVPEPSAGRKGSFLGANQSGKVGGSLKLVASEPEGARLQL
jgi:hypothetical protein